MRIFNIQQKEFFCNCPEGLLSFVLSQSQVVGEVECTWANCIVLAWTPIPGKVTFKVIDALQTYLAHWTQCSKISGTLGKSFESKYEFQDEMKRVLFDLQVLEGNIFIELSLYLASNSYIFEYLFDCYSNLTSALRLVAFQLQSLGRWVF
jgi:hypothetical protein